MFGIYEQDHENSCSLGVSSRSMSELSLSGNHLSRGAASGRAWATTGDLQYSSTGSFASMYGAHGRRCVTFSPAVRVVLIPTVEEYRAALIGQYIWWCDKDYKEFKADALREVRQYLSNRPGMDLKVAIRNIYEGMQATIDEADTALSERNEQGEDFPQDSNSTKASKSDSFLCRLRDAEQKSDSTDSDVNSPSAETKSSRRSHHAQRQAESDSFTPLKDRAKAHSFNGTPSAPTVISELPGLVRGKTDVDIVHEQQDELSDLLRSAACDEAEAAALASCYSDMVAAAVVKSRASGRRANKEPLHPLALICS